MVAKWHYSANTCFDIASLLHKDMSGTGTRAPDTDADTVAEQEGQQRWQVVIASRNRITGWSVAGLGASPAECSSPRQMVPMLNGEPAGCLQVSQPASQQCLSIPVRTVCAVGHSVGYSGYSTILV